MPEQIQQLEERIRKLEGIIYDIFFSDYLNVKKDIVMQDGKNIKCSSVFGTKIGTATGQKLSFYGVTPVDQPLTISDPSGGLTVDSEARTAINTIIDRLQELGLIA